MANKDCGKTFRKNAAKQHREQDCDDTNAPNAPVTLFAPP
jgi:hypothetical protein